jgi:uncharacterized membrane protein YeiH
MKTVKELAIEFREVAIRAYAALGPELGGSSIRDLAADNFPDVSLKDLDEVIVVAGFGMVLLLDDNKREQA